MEALTPYPHYKPTGIPWLGKIPKHWGVKRLKYVADITMGKMLTNDDKGGYFLKPYLRAANLRWLIVDIEDTKEMWFSEMELQKLRLYKNDLVVSEGGEVGRTAIWNNELDECYLQNSVHRIRTNNDCSARYFLYQFYHFGSIGYFESIVNRISIAHLTGEKIKEVPFYLPPLPEQTAIAQYLDEKTALLNKLIANKQQLITLLKEERTALINEAVNGQGKNWERKKLSHGFNKIGSGTTPASGNEEYYTNGTINWLQTGDLNDGEINDTSKKITPKALQDYSPLREYPAGSLVVAMYGATIGRVGVLNIATTTNQACCVLSHPTSFNTWFVFYWFVGNKEFVISRSYGGGQPNISQEHIKSFRIPCPPLPEQQSIVAHIQTHTQRIDGTIAKIEKEIELLQEYKTALISEVITGKVKVV